MSIRIFVDEAPTPDGKYRVLQEDSETKERFGVKDFETREEAQNAVDDMQRNIKNALAEKTAGELHGFPPEHDPAALHESKFKGTPQDLKDETSQD